MVYRFYVCSFLGGCPLYLFLIMLCFLPLCLDIFPQHAIYLLWIILNKIWDQIDAIFLQNGFIFALYRRLSLAISVPLQLIKEWDISKLIFMPLQKLAYLLLTLIYNLVNLVQCKVWSNSQTWQKDANPQIQEIQLNSSPS